jgi:hypothetical protein
MKSKIGRKAMKVVKQFLTTKYRENVQKIQMWTQWAGRSDGPAWYANP